jgi:hypothetical protein
VLCMCVMYVSTGYRYVCVVCENMNACVSVNVSYACMFV